MKAKADGISILLIATAVVLNLALERPDERRVLARHRIGPSLHSVPLDGPPAFQSDDHDQAILFFEQNGIQGSLQGAVVIRDDKIEDVLITQSNEGIDRKTLYDDHGFLQSFSGHPAQSPVVVDAISGATISSRLVINAVNERLQRWEDHVKRDGRNGGS